MWYVVQTFKGREIKDRDRIILEVAEDEEVFIIESERMYRIRGEWIKDTKPMFPGYIFVETDNPEEFRSRLRVKLPKLRMLTVEGRSAAIYPEEESYFRMISGEEHVARYSEGFRQGSTIEITSGAFKGYKGQIVKQDRHRRLARIIVPLMGREVEVEIGLGIVKSS